MRHRAGPAPSDRGRSWAIVAALFVVLLVGISAAVVAIGDERGATEDASTTTSTGPETADAEAPRSLTPKPAQRAASGLAEPPTEVRLPGGKEVSLRGVGTRTNGVLDVPDDVRTAGWWAGSSQLGDPFGSTLLAGHVDSVDQGLGAYAALLQVRQGARLELRSRHLQQEFVVRSLRIIPQGSLAAYDRIYSPRGERRLTLVTCAPPYVPEDGGYQNLAVVTAVPRSEPVRRGQ